MLTLKTNTSEPAAELDIQQEINALRLGTKIRQLPRRRNLTLQSASDPAGLPKSLLSLIENENTAPPIAALVRIARAMGVTIGYFFKKSRPDKRISFVPREQRYRLLGLPRSRVVPRHTYSGAAKAAVG